MLLGEGLWTVQIEGDASYEDEIRVAGTRNNFWIRRRSRALLVAGGVALGVGGILTYVALMEGMTRGESEQHGDSSSGPILVSALLSYGVGVGLMVAAVAHAAVVPAKPASPRPQFAVVPTPRGAAMVTAWRF